MCAAVLLGATVALPAAAEDKWSGGVWAVSDYLDHYESLSDGKPAVQAALTYTFDNSAYAGLSASTVNFGAGDGGELLATVGLARETMGVHWDLFAAQHLHSGFDGAREENFLEFGFNVAREAGPVTLVAQFLGAEGDGGGLEGRGFFGFEAETELRPNLKMVGSFGRMAFSQHADGEEDYYFHRTGLEWTHSSGFEVSFGVEGKGFDHDLIPFLSIGRSV